MSKTTNKNFKQKKKTHSSFKPCNHISDVVWGKWELGRCSASCGKAVRTETRTCISGDCEGNTSRTVDCQLDVCPG